MVLSLPHQCMWTTHGLLLGNPLCFCALQVCWICIVPLEGFLRRHIYLWSPVRIGFCRAPTFYFWGRWFCCFLLPLIWLPWDRKRVDWGCGRALINKWTLHYGGRTWRIGRLSFSTLVIIFLVALYTRGFVWTDLESHWYEKGIFWDREEFAVGVCILDVSGKAALKEKKNMTLWDKILNSAVPRMYEKD